MEEAQKMFEELMDDFERIGLPIKRKLIHPKLQWNNNCTSLGQCKWDRKKYTIFLSRNAMENKDSIRNTLAHELIHTLPGCMNHGPKFLAFTRYVWANLGINVETRASKEEADASGINDAYLRKARYKIECQGCGRVHYRQKKSALTQHPESYRCGECKGNFKVYDMKNGEELIGSPSKSGKTYAVKCMECGARYERRTKSKVIQHPNNYRCKCGGYLMRVL